MIRYLKNQIKKHYLLQRVSIALSKANAVLARRVVDETNPMSWEFSAFSQSNEDGIIDFLVHHLRVPNRYFVEIGASNGVENNTTWLGIALKYSGLMIEGDTEHSEALRLFLSLGLCIGVDQRRLFVTKENCRNILSWSVHTDPDVLSIDIDGNDYYVLEELLSSGMKPKIIAVEYNSAFGPTRSMTIPYRRDFVMEQSGPGSLYYGVSISAWKSLMKKNGYKFVTVDSNGINSFFIRESEFKSAFLKRIRGCHFQDNFLQRMRFRTDWRGQYKLIETRPFQEV